MEVGEAEKRVVGVVTGIDTMPIRKFLMIILRIFRCGTRQVRPVVSFHPELFIVKFLKLLHVDLLVH